MRPLAWTFRLVAIVVAGALLLATVVVAAAPRVWRIANSHEELPVVLPDFESLSQRTYVYDIVGNVIAVFERENSQPIRLAQVPTEVVDAILAVEDEGFYRHKGVNVRSLFRAALSNFASDAPRQGASTITQQVVKNELLAGLERDGRYKLLQVHYALMLEKEMSKDEILERYLNTIFFGNNAYGLQAAAEVYFGKSVEQLTMIEGAFLAGLVRSPSGYDPINRPERSRARFAQVVDRLLDVGLVTEAEALDLEENYEIPERLQSLPTFTTRPTYYTEALRTYLLERSNILGDTEQARANQLYRGGLRIYTTFDPTLQEYAEAARNELPENRAGVDAAILTLDSKTGAIRAMVGGRGFVPREREINMALVPRQTGSSIKFFVLAAALQAGAQPSDMIDGRRGCVLPNPGDPKNPFRITGGVAGSVTTLAQATWSSLNCAFARLSQIVGLNRVVDTTYRLAHSSYLYPEQSPEDRAPLQPYASFATGANEMSPLDMASGAQSIANMGVHHDPYYVEYIESADGRRIYQHEDPGVQVLDREVALTAIDILRGVLTRGTARNALADFPFPAAGKTGTQVDNTNSWFVGFTPKLATAVWVGDPDGYTQMTRENIPEFGAAGVSAVQGGTFPARIWGAFMRPALFGHPVEDWPAGPGDVRPAARLYLPGVECPYTPSAPVSTAPPADTAPPQEVPAEPEPAPQPDGFAGGNARAILPAVPIPTDPVPPPATNPPPQTAPPTAPPTTPPVQTIPPETAPPEETTPAETIPPDTTAPVVTIIVQQPPTDTTIPPDVVDPRAPLPMVSVGSGIALCAGAPR